LSAFIAAVFIAVYAGMALGRWPGLRVDRTGIALLGAIALVGFGAVAGESAARAIDAPTLIILFGLMVLSAQFAVSGFYDWSAAKLAASAASPARILAATVAVGGLLSTVLVNDIVVFAMAPLLSLGLARRGLDPRPHLLGLAGAANAGSAATIIGNPQNILIGEIGGLGFWSFAAVCAPPALVALVIVYGAVRWRWRAELGSAGTPAAPPPPPALDRGALAKSALALAVLLVLFTAPLERTLGVLLVAGLLLISRRVETRRILGFVDWHLLILFAGLFVVTAALTATGWPARALAALSEAGFGLAALPVLAPVAILGSNTIGNVPAVVLLLAVEPGFTANALYALALVSTLAGNLLLVGSICNIIVAERAREAGVTLTFADFARAGVPMTLLSIAVALAWLALIGRAPA
jgi:Na+/H+ antiporter NhaD/arsenite permease-like protein